MNRKAYAALDAARKEFRSLAERWSAASPYLLDLQERLRRELGYDDYRVETPIVYNGALDDIGSKDDIRVILVADNPGKNEQKAANRRYLVGHSGKLAEAWFGRELGMDFRREVLILNKTPVHTAKTAELRRLLALAGPERERLAGLLAESQAAMAGLAARLHAALGADSRAGGPILWISGLGELKEGGLFKTYRDELARLYRGAPKMLRGRVWAFNHFSMNQFAIELKRKADPELSIWENLTRIGTENRKRVLGF